MRQTKPFSVNTQAFRFPVNCSTIGKVCNIMGFGLHLWIRSRCPGSLRLVVLCPGSCTRGIQYSTHHSLNMDFGNTNSSLLKGASGAGRAPEHKHDYVGPFQLGLSPAALRQGEKMAKWSELSTRDKGTSWLMSSGHLV